AAEKKANLATKQVKSNLSWQKSADLIMERLKTLRNKPICRYEPMHDDNQKYQAGGIVLKSSEEMYQDIRPLMENEWHDAAISALGELLESDPDFGPAHGDLGALYYKIGDKDKAIAHYEKAALLEPDNTPVQKALADFYYVEQGKVEEALKIYRVVLENSPGDVATLMTAGHLSVASHKFDDAREFYGRVIKLEPWNTEAQQYLDKLTNMNDAESKFKTAEQWYQSLQDRMSSEQPGKGIAELEKLLQTYPDFALAHNDLGVLYYNRSEKEKALACYEKAAQLAPENVTFKKNLADFYCVEQGRLEDALKLYIGVLEIQPEDTETLLSLGEICTAFGKKADARVFFERILEIEPWNFKAREVLDKLQARGQESIQEKAPAEIYQDLQSEMAGQDPQAVIEAFEKLSATDPDFAPAHNDLGVLYYQSGEKEKALTHYERAAHLEPGNAIFQKNLADFYFVEQGRVEDALKIYVDVLAAYPEDIETLLITGHICVSLRKFDDARVFYNRVLELDPWNADARQNLEKLDEFREAV
ncbi:tetratricopeptide repeat protein, partial [bacterium]|nr:tetratricopeptide repeat protein [bacterium]